MNQRPVVAGIAHHQPDLFRFALDEARRLECGVRATHVYSVTELLELRGREPELFDTLRATAASESDPPPVDYLWWWGDPAEVLITESREASEVVIGVDEGTWLSRVAGGEVARKVALNAACPVLVYPTRRPTDRPTGHVVVAVDTSGPVEAPLLYAFEAARRRHESIIPGASADAVDSKTSSTPGACDTPTFRLSSSWKEGRWLRHVSLRRRMRRCSSSADLAIITPRCHSTLSQHACSDGLTHPWQ